MRISRFRTRPKTKWNTHSVLLIYLTTLAPFIIVFGCAPRTQVVDSNINGEGSQSVSENKVQHDSYAELRLLGPQDEIQMVYRTVNQKMLQEAILDPLSSAVPDPAPARYEVTGTLFIDLKGERTEVLVFMPWGRIKVDGEYKIADLSKLRDNIRRCWEGVDSFVLNSAE